MRASRDVKQVLLVLGVETITTRELVQLGKRLVEFPGILDRKLMRANAGLGRDLDNVLADLLDKFDVRLAVEQFNSRNQQIVVLANGNRGSPAIPTLVSTARVEA